MLDFGHDVFPVKMLATKSYIRLNEENEPQLVRVTPVSDMGMIDPDTVAIYLDEGEAKLMAREKLDWFLEVMGCVSLEVYTHWKHIKVH